MRCVGSIGRDARHSMQHSNSNSIPRSPIGASMLLKVSPSQNARPCESSLASLRLGLHLMHCAATTQSCRESANTWNERQIPAKLLLFTQPIVCYIVPRSGSGADFLLHCECCCKAIACLPRSWPYRLVQRVRGWPRPIENRAS